MSKVAEFCVLDIETTGLDPKVDRVIEVAAARFRGRELLETMHRLVRPGVLIPATASAVHHLTDDDLVQGWHWNDVQANLEDFAVDAVVVAHNAEFDRSFLSIFRDNRWLCTHRLARHLWPYAPRHQLQVLRYWRKLGVRVDRPHRAEGDVQVTAALLFDELAEYKRRGMTWKLNDVIRYADRPLPAKDSRLHLVPGA